MSEIVQQIVYGVSVGGVYMLFTVGLTLIYSVLKIFHIAHGATFTIGAFSSLYLFFLTQNILISAILGVMISGMFGIIVGLLVYRPLIPRGSMPPLMASIGIFIFVQELMISLFGAEPIIYPFSLLTAIKVFGIFIYTTHLLILAAAIISILVLWLYLEKTTIGLATKTIAQDRELASLTGINLNRIMLLTLFVGSIFGGLAGYLTSLHYSYVYQAMGLPAVVMGLAAVLLGGLGSFRGAVLASLAMGLAETFAGAYLPFFSRYTTSFALLIIVLLLRPQGLFGRK